MRKFIFFIIIFFFTKVLFSNTVYNCQMKENIHITEFENNLLDLENFSFKKTGDNLIFESGGYFNNHRMNLINDIGSYFRAENINETMIYNYDYFIYSSISNTEQYKDIISIIAICSSF